MTQPLSSNSTNSSTMDQSTTNKEHDFYIAPRKFSYIKPNQPLLPSQPSTAKQRSNQFQQSTKNQESTKAQTNKTQKIKQQEKTGQIKFVERKVYFQAQVLYDFVSEEPGVELSVKGLSCSN